MKEQENRDEKRGKKREGGEVTTRERKEYVTKTNEKKSRKREGTRKQRRKEKK